MGGNFELSLHVMGTSCFVFGIVVFLRDVCLGATVFGFIGSLLSTLFLFLGF